MFLFFSSCLHISRWPDLQRQTSSVRHTQGHGKEESEGDNGASGGNGPSPSSPSHTQPLPLVPPVPVRNPTGHGALPPHEFGFEPVTNPVKHPGAPDAYPYDHPGYFKEFRYPLARSNTRSGLAGIGTPRVPREQQPEQQYAPEQQYLPEQEYPPEQEYSPAEQPYAQDQYPPQPYLHPPERRYPPAHHSPPAENPQANSSHPSHTDNRKPSHGLSDPPQSDQNHRTGRHPTTP
jgi:hypothetical protein